MKIILYTIAAMLCASLLLATPIVVSAKKEAPSLKWVSQFGTSNDDYSLGLALDSSGDAYVIGYTYGAFPGQASSGGADAFLSKYNDKGKMVWMKQFGTSSDEGASGIAIAHHEIYVVGDTYGVLPGQTSSGGDDAYIAKFDDKGKMLWTRQFGTGTTDWATGISVSDSSVYVLGGTTGALPGQTSSGGDDAYVAKLDVKGNMLWVKQFGTTALDKATGILIKDSGIYIAGFTSGTFPGQTSAGREDAFLAKLDSSGNMLWVKQFGTDSDDEVYSISADSSGFYLAGFTVGAFPGQASSGDFDAFIAKLDSSGNMIWVRQFGTDTYDDATGVDSEAPGIYVAGITWGTFPGQTSTESDDSFVAKYDSSGNMLWLRQFGTEGNDYVYGIAADRSGVYVTGQTDGKFKGEKSAGGVDAFIAKLKKTSDHAPLGWDDGKKSGWDNTVPPSSGGDEAFGKRSRTKGHKIAISIG